MRTFRTLGIVLSAAIIALLSLSATAYKTQKGYVKTRGRYTSQGTLVPGKPLSNAVVMIRNSNSTRSDAKGNFSVTLPEQNFYLQNVKKEGYILSDPDVLKRRYSCSASPLVLVLETPQQQADDRLASEKKLRRTLQRKLQAKEDELEALKEENKITTEEYRNALQELYKLQETNEKFISEMAERYSRIDFDALDDFQRQIAAYIQDGELARADSLLNTKGSMDDREAEINRLREANTQRREEIAKEQQELEASENLAAAKLADFGADCYNRFQISRLELKNDTAAYWLERRANADTTNIDWQLDAGLFLSDYLADYDKALHYYHTALDHSLKTNGEQSSSTALIYNDIGTALINKAYFTQALEYFNKSLVISQNSDDSSWNVAKTLINIGMTYYNQGDYKHALEFNQNALEILSCANTDNRDFRDVATCLNNMGGILCVQGDYTNALTCYNIALNILRNQLGNCKPDIATVYNNIAGIYAYQGKHSEALELFKKALTILRRDYTEKHPFIAKCLNNISGILIKQENYTDAIKYLETAINIQKEILPVYHPDISLAYNNLGLALANTNDFKGAIKYYSEGLKARINNLGESHPDIANSYINIAGIYVRQKKWDNALDLYNKSLDILKKTLPETHPTVANVLLGIGVVLNEKGSYNSALESCDKAMDILLHNFNDTHPDLISCYDMLGNININLQNYSVAKYYYTKALDTRTHLYTNYHPSIPYTLGNIAFCDYNLKEYSEALKNLNKALELFNSNDPNSSEAVKVKFLISEIEKEIKCQSDETEK